MPSFWRSVAYWSVLRFVAVGLAFGSAARPSPGQSAVEFYRGKQIRMIVGHPAGGDYDIGGRLLAKYLPNHIPGHPTVVVENMPGAASIAATNYLFTVAPKDGSVFGSFSRNIPSQAVLGRSNIEADPRLFSWVGASSLPSRVCVSWFTSEVVTATDAFEKPLIVAGGGASSALTIIPTVLNTVAGTKFKVVRGYAGFPEAMLALQQNEVQGLCNTLEDLKEHEDLIAEGKMRILFHTEEVPIPDQPEVPSIFSYVRDNAKRRALLFVFSSSEFGRPYVLPPGVPADRVEIMRTAFKATLEDPALRADARSTKLDMSYRSPEVLLRLVKELYDTPPGVLDRIRSLIPAGGG